MKNNLPSKLNMKENESFLVFRSENYYFIFQTPLIVKRKDVIPTQVSNDRPPDLKHDALDYRTTVSCLF